MSVQSAFAYCHLRARLRQRHDGIDLDASVPTPDGESFGPFHQVAKIIP